MGSQLRAVFKICLLCGLTSLIISQRSVTLLSQPCKHKMGNFRPTNETPFEWRFFAGGPIVTRNCMLAAGLPVLSGFIFPSFTDNFSGIELSVYERMWLVRTQTRPLHATHAGLVINNSTRNSVLGIFTRIGTSYL